MKENIILFIIFFIIIYIIYYLFYVRKHLRYNKKKISSDVKILESYYKIDIKKIGYQKVLRILNFVNALMLSIIMMVVIKFDKIIYEVILAIVLMFPFIWVTYYFLAKYLKYLERKSDENV